MLLLMNNINLVNTALQFSMAGTMAMLSPSDADAMRRYGQSEPLVKVERSLSAVPLEVSRRVYTQKRFDDDFDFMTPVDVAVRSPCSRH